MEESAPKRRRISPRLAVALDAGGRASPGTPLDGLALGLSIARPAGPGPFGRTPSYATPTKASLGRHNPDILRRRISPALPGAAGGAQTASSRFASSQKNFRVVDNAGADGAPAPSSQGQRDMAGTARFEEEDRDALESAGSPNPQSTTPPDPPPGERIGRESFNPAPPREPPDLPQPPDDPTLRGSTNSLAGLHNTPSKRWNRPRAAGEQPRGGWPQHRPQKGLPPEPMTTAPAGPGSAPEHAGRVRLQDGEVSALMKKIRGIHPLNPDADKTKIRDSLIAEVAGLERDLGIASQENERIRQSIVLGKGENLPPPNNKDEILDVLRRHAVPSDKNAPGPPDPAMAWLHAALNPMGLLPFGKPSSVEAALVAPSRTQPDEEEESPSARSHHPLPMTAEEALPYLGVFTPLAFTSQITTLPVAPPRQQPTADADAGAAAPAAPPQHLLQLHTITATSASPPGLFSCRIDMTVDTRTLAVTELAVPRIDPAAHAELQPLLEQVLGTRTGGENNSSSSALTRNVNVLCFALGEWLRVSVRRARAWRVLERELASGRAALEDAVGKTRELKKKRAHRSRKKSARGRAARGDDGEASDDNDDDAAAAAAHGERNQAAKDGRAPLPETAAHLLPYMGKTSMDFRIPVLAARNPGEDGDGDEVDERGEGAHNCSTLRVLWRIEFDWTGEAANRVRVLVGVPGKWHTCDGRGRLSGIPLLFDELIRGNEDPVDAVRTVASLLAGEQPT